MRLDKFLAISSIGRRKDVRSYIKEGMVKVNGSLITEPAIEIDENSDVIEYLNKVVTYIGKVYYMFNKPAGCVTARRDDVNKTVFDYFNDVNMEGIFHVGRLDKDTEGLLLLTNDGEFEHKLMYPEKHVEKTYYFWALGSLHEDDIKKLKEGLYIQKGEIRTRPAKIQVQNCGTYKEYKHEMNINNLYNIDSNYYNQPVVSGYLTISEGRKHQVKRMLKAVGCYVVYLKRVSIGELKLDESLDKGQYRVLNEDEIQSLIGNLKK
ncbi:pseudouridine synthase [Clostridium saccharobutylicum]|uniref:Pseudouridine synthase n=1 Tax=Clostridium saccharobutylicum DSM 13864 TaxID=1345695 RepID=U5MQU9_CLOSA|nr:pseudouridine synthase [Clostridium saccharobutylicum]AGX43184.1 RNA pseudouridine synthase YtzG [Clostridium saccharobutylicum DSM 13864]AQR90483.1 ribosomal small subunit pseudouridine synthase A [Clostridium saccharobutylicum]AQS00389.1 ribosomal small subunit pseudouridine synthase A [Clostridium saccharobutylicum]AQS14372.1 ribosomal small subunit pseudouridine synthase A [Clostridium saccharobutylicum]MBA2906657.1 16S rRNA pseudouridine516 synthase [Clostridium saccharobutylicum]